MHEANGATLKYAAPLARALFFRSSRLVLCRALLVRALPRKPWGLSEARGREAGGATVARTGAIFFALLGAFVLAGASFCTVLTVQSFWMPGLVFQPGICFCDQISGERCLPGYVAPCASLFHFGSGFGPIGMLPLVNVVTTYIQVTMERANSMLPASSRCSSVDLRREFSLE